MARRPKRSAIKDTSSVEMKNPANNAATKLAKPVMPKKLTVVGENILALNRPGPRAPMSPIA